MCGIVGYIGTKKAVNVIVEGLTRLEYRGYDSAGIAVPDGDDVVIVRAVGKLDNLKKNLQGKELPGHMGIGHTRWATHGRPSEVNAHPHRSGHIVLVHNGIIENYRSLKADLERSGYTFQSDTDTEVVAHLIHSLYTGDLLRAVMDAAKKIKGSYALAVIDADKPDQMVVTRRDNPLVIGVSKDTNEYIAASDIPAALQITKDFIMLGEGEFALLTHSDVSVYAPDGTKIQKDMRHVDWDPVMAEKDGYPHFMLKEIHEQPRVIMDTLRGKINPDEGKIFLGELAGLRDKVADIERIIFIACGTSLNSSMVGKLYIEKYSQIPVEVDIASEFIQRSLPLNENVLVVCVSQSGETADTKMALRKARERGAKTAAVCNVVGSAIAIEADYTIYTHAGPEISVASTKAFTSQTITLMMFALWLGECRNKIDRRQISIVLKEVLHLPEKLKRILENKESIQEVARKYIQSSSMLFIARHYNYPIAYEGALKLKEISYIHAEGYASGELKHGPIALINEGFPVMALAPDGEARDKVLSAIQEVTARGASVIAVVTEGSGAVVDCTDKISIPYCPEEVSVFLTVMVSQLFAYYSAIALGRDVDKPRNLAKSVTVE